MKLPNETIFYSIERAIKEYRRLAQKNISIEIPTITIDQAMVLIFLKKYPDLSQKEIAELVFKDAASVTRTIELMTKNGYLSRSINHKDKRRYSLRLTEMGVQVLDKMKGIIISNRNKALKGVTDDEIKQVETTLNKIIDNCSDHR